LVSGLFQWPSQPFPKSLIASSGHEPCGDFRTREIIEHPDIEGIVGYSEGATMAASLILDEDRKAQEIGRPRRHRGTS
jgi:hypothetical protein